MNVIMINEENHGLIGVALNYRSAVKWLIDTHWLDNNTKVYDDNAYEWRPIKDVFGKNWTNLVLNTWDLTHFNDFLNGWFSLSSEKVIGTESK